jgi:hypothetical protein
VSEDEEQGGVKIGWVLMIEFDLAFEVGSGVIEGVDFIHPEGLLIEGVEPQSKTNDQTKEKDNHFFPVCPIFNGTVKIHRVQSHFLARQ